jgi:hypothetical protein
MADRVPPGVVDLTDLVDIEFTRPVGHGAYADVYKQKFGKTYVAVKVLRKFTQSLVSSHDYEKVSPLKVSQQMLIVLCSEYTKSYQRGLNLNMKTY